MHLLRHNLQRAGRLLVSYSATIVLTSIVILVGWYTHGNSSAQHQALLERVGSDVDGFGIRRILTIPFATFVQSTPGVEWHMVLLVAIPLILVERTLGSRRTAITFLLSDWISAPLTLVAIWALAQLGSHQAESLLDIADAGSSAAAHGTLAVACMLLPPPWRTLALSGLYTFIVSALVFQRLDASVAHFLATIVGSCIGTYWLRHRSPE